MKTSHFPTLISVTRQTWQRAVMGLTLASLTLSPMAHAVVDDAHSMAIALAAGDSAKGFRVRAEYWKGEMTAGQTKTVKAQLFKGNEYWFWGGVDVDKDAKVTITLSDTKGKVLQAQTVSGDDAGGARILPPRTGTYIVGITVTTAQTGSFAWAIAYGYR
jgi:hypothetical protein